MCYNASVCNCIIIKKKKNNFHIEKLKAFKAPKTYGSFLKQKKGRIVTKKIS